MGSLREPIWALNTGLEVRKDVFLHTKKFLFTQMHVQAGSELARVAPLQDGEFRGCCSTAGPTGGGQAASRLVRVGTSRDRDFRESHSNPIQGFVAPKSRRSGWRIFQETIHTPGFRQLVTSKSVRFGWLPFQETCQTLRFRRPASPKSARFSWLPCPENNHTPGFR